MDTAQLEKVLQCDPYAVVIGSAITRPMDITKHFANVFDKRRTKMDKFKGLFSALLTPFNERQQY